MQYIFSAIPMIAAIGLLLFVVLRMNNDRHRQLTVISLSVFVFTQFIFFFPDNMIVDDVYGSTEKMLIKRESEDEMSYERDDVHYIDGQEYHEIYVFEVYGWADVLFCLMNLCQSGAICLLVWVVMDLRKEDEGEIELAETVHY